MVIENEQKQNGNPTNLLPESNIQAKDLLQSLGNPLTPVRAELHEWVQQITENLPAGVAPSVQRTLDGSVDRWTDPVPLANRVIPGAGTVMHLANLTFSEDIQPCEREARLTTVGVGLALAPLAAAVGSIDRLTGLANRLLGTDIPALDPVGRIETHVREQCEARLSEEARQQTAAIVGGLPNLAMAEMGPNGARTIAPTEIGVREQQIGESPTR